MLPTLVAALLLAPREPQQHFLPSSHRLSLDSEASAERWLAEPASARLRAAPVPDDLALRPLDRTAGPDAVVLDAAHTALARGDLRTAAAALERLADTSPTPVALAARFNALAITIGLGEQQPRLWSLEPLALTRGPHTRSAAVLFWSAAALLPDDAARVWHARVYLRGFADRGGHDLQARAELIVGRDLWRRACPIAEIDGTCGVLAPVDWYYGCFDHQREHLFVLERDARLVTAAMRHIASALVHAEAREPLDSARSEARRDVASQARWLLTEPEFEALARLAAPWPGDGVEPWLAERGPLGRLQLAEQYDQRADESSEIQRRILRHNDLMRQYDRVIADRSPRTLNATLLRGAQLLHAHALYLGREANPPPAGGFCCGSISDHPRDAAEQTLATCERLARATANIDPWAERCIALLHGPAAPELHATRTRPAPVSFTVQLDHPPHDFATTTSSSSLSQ